MTTLPVLAVWSLLSGGVATPALAADAIAGSANVTVRLVSEVPAIEAGRTFTVALHMTMAPSWHTYWKNPGDSGMPTRVVWTLPDGFKASDLRWPTPMRAVDAGLALYGYEGEVTFLADITPGVDLPKGRFTLSARVSWLECKDICIPGKATVELVLPRADTAVKAPLDPALKPLFSKARASLPRKESALKVSHAVEGDHVLLKIASPPAGFGSPLEFFPETAGLIEAAEPQTVSRAATGWTISMKRAANSPSTTSLRGVLVATSGARRVAYEIAP